MLDFFTRCALVFLAIIGLYAVIFVCIYWDQIRRAMQLQDKYGYAWFTAWSVAGTETAIDRHIKRAKQHRRPS